MKYNVTIYVGIDKKTDQRFYQIIPVEADYFHSQNEELQFVVKTEDNKYETVAAFGRGQWTSVLKDKSD